MSQQNEEKSQNLETTFIFHQNRHCMHFSLLFNLGFHFFFLLNMCQELHPKFFWTLFDSDSKNMKHSILVHFDLTSLSRRLFKYMF